MASVGDKVRVLSGKGGQPPRDGVVTAVSGALLRIRWSSGEETSLIPGPGVMTVVGRARSRSAGAAKSAQAAKKKSTKPATAVKKASKASSGKSSKAGKPKRA